MSVVVNIDQGLVKNAASVMEMMVMVSLERAPEPHPAVEGDALLGMITFEGPIHGCLGILCSKECAAHLAAQMLCVENSEELSVEEVEDAIREITNMIMGAVKGDVDLGFDQVQLSIPMVVRGRKIQHDLGEPHETLVVHTLVEGRFPVELTLLWKEEGQ